MWSINLNIVRALRNNPNKNIMSDTWTSAHAAEMYATFPALVDGRVWNKQRQFFGKFKNLYQCAYHDAANCRMPRLVQFGKEPNEEYIVDRDVLHKNKRVYFSGKISDDENVGVIRLRNNKSYMCKYCVARITEFIRQDPSDVYRLAASRLRHHSDVQPSLQCEIDRAVQGAPTHPGAYPLFDTMLTWTEDHLDKFQNTNAYTHEFEIRPPMPRVVNISDAAEDDAAEDDAAEDCMHMFATAYSAFFQNAVACPAKNMEPPRISDLAHYYLNGLPQENYVTLSIFLKLAEWFDDGKSTQAEQLVLVNDMLAAKNANPTQGRISVDLLDDAAYIGMDFDFAQFMEDKWVGETSAEN